MTIGIAAKGPNAGAGVFAGLRAVENIGRGAIKGFVSLAVLTEDQKLLRADTQDGGTRGLFDGPPPPVVLQAPYAALISSGPNRPRPLSQFIAAEPGVGIVTGHRFPHVHTDEGDALNDLVLRAIRRGVPAQDAIDEVIAAHSSYDAGFIALSSNGDMGLGNMPLVMRLSHHGATHAHCAETGAEVAILHNAIQPNRAIAVVASEVTLDEIRRSVTEIQTITVSAGLELSFGDAPEIHIDTNFKTTRIAHPDSQTLGQDKSFGIGDRVKVVQLGHQIGWLGHEPFMVVKNGAILTLDGKSEVKLPVLIGKLAEP